MIVLLFLYSCACHNLCIIMILPHDKDANEIMTFITVNMFLLSVAGRSFFELRTKISWKKVDIIFYQIRADVN